jgi:hypothetical protein
MHDLDAIENHWKYGSHVHFTNWLWPSARPRSILSEFVEEEQRPHTVYLRFDETTKNDRHS